MKEILLKHSCRNATPTKVTQECKCTTNHNLILLNILSKMHHHSQNSKLTAKMPTFHIMPYRQEYMLIALTEAPTCVSLCSTLLGGIIWSCAAGSQPILVVGMKPAILLVTFKKRGVIIRLYIANNLWKYRRGRGSWNDMQNNAAKEGCSMFIKYHIKYHYFAVKTALNLVSNTYIISLFITFSL